MYRVITVPLDRSDTCERALPVAAALARGLDVPLELVHVVYEGVPKDPHRGHLEKRRAALGLPDGPSTVINYGVPAEALAELAADRDRLLCFTTHAKPLTELVLGSVASSLIRHAPSPVLVVGPNAGVDDVRFESLVACVDGTPLSEQIVQPAVQLARALAMKCWLLEVLDPDGLPTPDVLDTAYVHRLADQRRAQEGDELDWEVVHGAAAPSIVRFAQDLPASIIAMSTHARGPVGRVVLGSVAESVVHRASCPVLLQTPREGT